MASFLNLVPSDGKVFSATSPSSIPQTNTETKSVSKKRLVCQICNREFKSHSMLMQHCFNHADPRPYECEVCLEKFAHRAKLEKHSVCHEIIVMAPDEVAVNESEMDESMVCELCNKRVRDRTTLKLHVKWSHNMENRHECEICKKKFLSFSNLRTHARIHTREKPSLQKYSLSHQINVSPGKGAVNESVGDESVVCELCNKRARNRTALKHHIKWTHNAERRYKCEICKKKFLSLSNLTTHIRIHTGEKPFACDFCTMEFAYKSTLNHHLRSQHDRGITSSNKAPKKNKVRSTTTISQLLNIQGPCPPGKVMD